MLAFLGWLKGQGIDSEVNTVTVSTPPRPKSYFVDTEWGRMSPTRDQVVKALRELGPSRTKVIAAHLGWDFQRTSSQLSKLGKLGLAVRKGRCVWELVPAGTVVVPRIGSSQGPASDHSGGEGEDAIGVGVEWDDDGEVGFELDDLGGGRVTVEPEPIRVGIGELSPGEDVTLRDGATA